MTKLLQVIYKKPWLRYALSIVFGCVGSFAFMFGAGLAIAYPIKPLSYILRVTLSHPEVLIFLSIAGFAFAMMTLEIFNMPASAFYSSHDKKEKTLVFIGGIPFWV